MADEERLVCKVAIAAERDLTEEEIPYGIGAIVVDQ
jgi:hypothetical protein